MAANFAYKVKVSCGHGYGFLRKVLVHPSTTSSSFKVITRCFSSSSPVVADVVSAAHLDTSSPWLMLHPEIDPVTNRKIDRFYSMTDRRILKLERKSSLKVPEEARCFGSSRGWLGFIDPNDCSLLLTNPFRDVFLIRLPSIKTLPAEVLSVKRKRSSTPYIRVDKPIDSDLTSKFFVEHLTLSCLPFNGEEGDCIAMIAHGPNTQLSFCRFGKEEAWTPLTGATTSNPQTVYPLKGVNLSMFNALLGEYDDVNLFYSMYSDMFGYGIDAWHVLEPWKIHARRANFMYQERGTTLQEEFKFTKSERMIRNRCRSLHYLVVDELSGDIMLVIRYYAAPHVLTEEDATNIVEDCKTLRFDVYKVDMKNRKLKRAKCLGDLVIFLGLNQSFTLSACEFPGLRPNSIYFTDDYYTSMISHGIYDLGIYNLKDKSIEPCYPFPDELNKDERIRPPLIWVAPNCTC